MFIDSGATNLHIQHLKKFEGLYYILGVHYLHHELAGCMFRTYYSFSSTKSLQWTYMYIAGDYFDIFTDIAVDLFSFI